MDKNVVQKVKEKQEKNIHWVFPRSPRIREPACEIKPAEAEVLQG